MDADVKDVNRADEDGKDVLTVRVLYGALKDADRQTLDQFVQDQQMWRGEVAGG